MSSYNNVGIFWDYENCAPSSTSSGYHLIDRIRQLCHRFGSVNVFKAYQQFPEKSSPKLYSLRSELQACGVSLTDCPHNGKNSVDLMMIVDIMAFVKDNPAPATVVLISGDRDFAYLLSTIRWRQYNVVLISNTFMTHDSLRSQANTTFDWQTDVLKSRNDMDTLRSSSNRARRDTSTSTPGIHVTLDSVDSIQRSLNNGIILLSHQESRPVSSEVEVSTTLHTPDSSAGPDALVICHQNFASEDTSARLDSSKLPVYDDPVYEEESTAISSVSSLSSQIDDWVLTDRSPTTDKQVLSVGDGTTPSPVFSSPELVPSEIEGDIPSSPGYLLLVGESDNGAESTPVEQSKTTGEPAKCPCIQEDGKLVEQNCDCRICLRSASCSTTESVRSDSVQELAPTTPTPAKSDLEPETTLPVSTVHSNVNKPDIVCSTLNVMAPKFAPQYASTETSGISTPQLVPIPKPEFKDLITILRDLRVKGIEKPRFTVVAPLLLARKPNVYQSAGVSQLKSYLQLAENMRIVTIEHDQDDDDEWISLRHPWDNRGSLPSCPRIHAQTFRSSVTQKPPEAMFQDLIVVLSKLRMSGDFEPGFSAVLPRLLTTNPNPYVEAGTTNFKDYIEAAAEAGIVTVQVQNGDGWIHLCDKWFIRSDKCSPSLPESPPNRPVLAQKKPSSSVFQQLVTVLQDCRTRGNHNVSGLEIFQNFYQSGQSLEDIYKLAGASTLTEYLTAAVSAGIISIGGDVSGVYSPICLLNSGDVTGTGDATDLLPLDFMAAHVPPSASIFKDLEHVLKELSRTNLTEFLFSTVEPLVLARNTRAFEQAGVSTFKEYVHLAAKAGVIIANYFAAAHSDNGWVKLPHQPVSLQKPKPSDTKQTKPSNVETSPLENATHIFRDLVLVLQQLRSSGESESRFTSVASLLLQRNPNAYKSAGVTKFKEYIGLAVDAEVVSVRENLKNGDAWITFCDTGPGNNWTNSPSRSALLSVKTSRSSDKIVTPSPPIPSMYRELVWLLRQRQSTGDSEPLFSAIASAFKKNPELLARSFGQVGAQKFKQYAESARDAGIVTLPNSKRVGEERMRLCPAWEGKNFVPVEDW